MANKFTYQVLRDTTADAVIKLTGQFDGSSGNEANNARVAANSLYGALNTTGGLLSVGGTALSYYELQLMSAQYFVSMSTASPPGSVEVFWAGNTTANNATIFYLNGNGEYGSQQNPAIYNNAVNPNGNLGINTYGVSSNTAYTLILTFRKNNAMYQRGQYNDPAAFNFGSYALQPR
jgi:hypothetical protein